MSIAALLASGLSAQGQDIDIDEICANPYWPFSEFTEAPAAFDFFLDQWPSNEAANRIRDEHHNRVALEFRPSVGACQPGGISVFLDNMFGGIFNSSEEQRKRVNNGVYRHLATSCTAINWASIDGTITHQTAASPHILRMATAQDPMCGENPMYLTLRNGLIAVDLIGGSCDITEFSADQVRGVTLHSIFSGVHSAESIVERLNDYIGEGDQLSLPVAEPSLPQHLERGVAPLANAQAIFPSLFPERSAALPFGRSYRGQYFLIYPTISNPRGESNKFFPTFPSSLRIDMIDVTDQERVRRQRRDICYQQQQNADQPRLNFRSP